MPARHLLQRINVWLSPAQGGATQGLPEAWSAEVTAQREGAIMNDGNSRGMLQEVERIADQAEHLRPCWDGLLERAHAVSEQIVARAQQATGDSDLTAQGRRKPPAPWGAGG
jgi:hypothetical protein